MKGFVSDFQSYLQILLSIWSLGVGGEDYRSEKYIYKILLLKVQSVDN